MNHYRYLDLDYRSIVDEMSNHLKNEFIQKQSFFVPLKSFNLLKKFPKLKNLFAPLGIHINESALIVSNSSWHNFIHIDDPSDTSRINIPILNCEKSKTNFYELKQGKSLRTDPEGILSNVYYALPEECNLIDSFCLDKPAVLRTSILHNVVLDADVLQRISLTFSFEENIDYLLD